MREKIYNDVVERLTCKLSISLYKTVPKRYIQFL